MLPFESGHQTGASNAEAATAICGQPRKARDFLSAEKAASTQSVLSRTVRFTSAKAAVCQARVDVVAAVARYVREIA